MFPRLMNSERSSRTSNKYSSLMYSRISQGMPFRDLMYYLKDVIVLVSLNGGSAIVHLFVYFDLLFLFARFYIYLEVFMYYSLRCLGYCYNFFSLWPYLWLLFKINSLNSCPVNSVRLNVELLGLAPQVKFLATKE